MHNNSIMLPLLEKLELKVSETKFAVSFFDSIKEFPQVACIFIYIEQILPFKHELEQVSHHLQLLCSPMLLWTLDISFHDSGAHHTGLPPLMPENQGYTLQFLTSCVLPSCVLPICTTSTFAPKQQLYGKNVICMDRSHIHQN